MKKWQISIVILASLVFSGCSIQQNFIIANSTDQPIVIQYSLNNPTGENALFGVEGEVYQSNRDYYPNWEHKLPYQDLDISQNNVKIKLGPKSTLVFGVLLNEKYDSNAKKSTGGKVFNMEKMTFTVNGIDFLIDESNFHDFFIEDSGMFQYIIQ